MNERKKIVVRHLCKTPQCAKELFPEFDKAEIERHEIGCVDWEKTYPYKPTVSFRVAHFGKSIGICYEVDEETVRAVAPHDCGRVWEDSCCEFFFQPVEGSFYYNVECNAAGTLLVAAGMERNNREAAPKKVLDGVDRWSSLGREPFEEHKAKGMWQLALIIPVETFFKTKLESLNGLQAKANFYKCGDLTSKPHFLSWNRILIETPDFHRPDFFGDMLFE